MRVFAIDPGPVQSGYVIWDGREILGMGIEDNDDLLSLIDGHHPADVLVVEEVCCYGMTVGKPVFETVFWTGRFCQAWSGRFDRLPRMDVKMHLCHDSRAKPKNISQALRDRFGEKGTKKAPGLLYGVKDHIWAALALGVTFWDKENPGAMRPRG